jgi:sugar/nucleoside kinase (ribokinase family)
MSLLVVGSVAFDTLETPHGRAERVLGGSATYFAVSASFLTRVNLVGVVGDDWGDAQMNAFAGRDIDVSGLERLPGKTFHWQGRYSDDMNSRDTVCTDLNVFASFQPKISEAYRKSDRVFLGNIHPTLQEDVLDQVDRPKLVGADTMNLWINGAPAELAKTLARVEALLINDSEARELTKETNLVKAARKIQAMGPSVVIIKKGEHGALLFNDHSSIFSAPALPIENVFDPTGAGDTFGGGFMGFIDRAGSQDDKTLRQAVIMGSTMASFCVEKFSLDRLLELTKPEIDARFKRFSELTHFDRVS